MSYTIKMYNDGLMSANCYILKDDNSGEALVVDPGVYNRRFEELLCSIGISKLSYILLTHGHFDHVMGVSALKSSFGGQIVIHESDEVCLGDSDRSLASVFGYEQNFAEADITVCDGDVLPFGGNEIKVMHTPGHTVGSVCYILGKLMFTGDTLFKCSVGRVDFPGGSEKEMISSLMRLKAIDEDFVVYPGHEGKTSLKEEKLSNPFMRGI